MNAHAASSPARAGAPTVAQVGEFVLIERITRILTTGEQVALGPGDDAAVLMTLEGPVVVSTDLLIENRHFRLDWSTATDIGRKAAACNLSDLNAMGGTASVLTLGLGLPGDTPISWVDDFVAGVVLEAGQVGAHVVGGDITAAEQIVISVTVIGRALRPVTRSGARPGDVVAVSGDLGLAGAGFAALSRGFGSPRAAVDAHRVPRPPYLAGPAGAMAGATAMVDISDGLLADLGHVARLSEVSIDLDLAALEIPSAVATIAEALGRDSIAFVLTGGDDYALAATFPSAAAVPASWRTIGRVHAGAPGVTVGGLVWDGAPGHQHFR